MSTVEPHPQRRDWWIWRNPDPLWCSAYGDVPGLQPWGDGARVLGIQFHRSHLPLMPVQPSIVPRYPEAVGRGMFLAEKGINLRPYQAQDLPFLMERRGTLLAYEMRLGKTLTACVAHDPSDGMLVVVGPLVSRDVWREWIERVYGVPPLVLSGRTNVELQPGYPAYFIHYDVLEAHTPFFTGQKIGTLVLDEVHLLQSGKAKRSQAAAILAVRSTRILGLSGTPMWNNADSLYQILHLVSPGAWGNHHDFGVRYADGRATSHGWQYKGVSRGEEMRARLAEVMVRRRWADVAPDLPPTTRVIEPVEVPLAKLAAIESATMHALLARGTGGVAQYLAVLRRKLGDLKGRPAVDAAARIMMDGHKVVVWAWHREVADHIATWLGQSLGKAGKDISPVYPVFRLRAEDSQDARMEQVERFRATAGPAVMVAGIAVGGVAIDLSCATHAVFAELEWIPAMVYQAEMRTFHPSRPHVVTYLVADVPVEMRLIEALGAREGFQAALGLGGDEVARMVLG
jgi:SWI/SNF-related matrix-associated actin-dependent regulator 1 of chromatin subfamily A